MFYANRNGSARTRKSPGLQGGSETLETDADWRKEFVLD